MTRNQTLDNMLKESNYLPIVLDLGYYNCITHVYIKRITSAGAVNEIFYHIGFILESLHMKWNSIPSNCIGHWN